MINLTPMTSKQKIGPFNNIPYSKHARGYNILKNENILKRIVYLLLISLIFTTQAQATQTTISISDVSVDSGDDIIATLMLNDVTDYGTGTIKVTYNPSIAQVTGVEGSTDSVITAWNADNNAGNVLISAWNMNGKSGDVVFAGIKFQAVATSGSTALTLDVDTLQDTSYNEIPTILDHGSLSITGSSEPPDGYEGDKPLTVFFHDTFTGDLTYVTGSSYYSGKLYSNDEYQINHTISIPADATVTFARLYAYWTWSALGSTGRYPDLKLTFDGDELSLDGNYTDRKGFAPYDYPGGTWAYDVTSFVAGSGEHTTVIENTGPDGSYFAVNGVGLLVVYTEPNGDEIECWIAEGCDYISSQDESGLTPEEATTDVVFSGTIDLSIIEEAKLTTVVQSGNDADNMLIFNFKNWTGIYDGTPYGDLDVNEQEVLDHLIYNDNTAKIRAVDDYMAPSNAFLVLTRTSSETSPPPSSGDGNVVSLTAYIIPAISIEVTPSSVNFGSLGPGEISANKEIDIKNKGASTIDVTSEVTDNANNLYVSGLEIDNLPWSVYETQLGASASTDASLRLKVPGNYAGVGEQQGVLMFWAQQT